MAHEYELRRITDRLKTLNDEQKRINARILQSRRDEQFDLDHIRRKYNNVIFQLEERQEHVRKELERREKELSALQKRIAKEFEEEKDASETPNLMKHQRRRLQ